MLDARKRRTVAPWKFKVWKKEIKTYRMSKDVLMEILHGVTEYDERCCWQGGFSSIQKFITAMRMLAYESSVDSWDDYLRMSESTTIERMYKFS
jgi:hypothetical protein